MLTSCCFLSAPFPPSPYSTPSLPLHHLCLSSCHSLFSILYGLPAEEISRLKNVHNNAARLVLRKKKYDHITPFLKQLHWLPVNFRTQFKIACLAFRKFNGTLPPYLSEKLHIYQPARPLRSASEKTLVPPTFNLKTAGERSFQFLAPSVWNDLPSDIRDLPTLSAFKAGLKTHLFRTAFH